MDILAVPFYILIGGFWILCAFIWNVVVAFPIWVCTAFNVNIAVPLWPNFK